jgi:Ca-activated chloride channel homolog
LPLAGSTENVRSACIFLLSAKCGSILRKNHGLSPMLVSAYCWHHSLSLVRLFLMLGWVVVPNQLAWSQSAGESQSRSSIADSPASDADRIRIAGEPRLENHRNPLTVNVDLVQIPVTVTDAMNHPVTNLKKEDFAIYENGVQQQIFHFFSEDGPISVGLILDFSKSMTNKVQTERAAVEEFIRNANPEDDYFVVTVSSRPQLIATSSNSVQAIESALGQITPDGSTALLDAIYLGANQMRRACHSRHALVIISDGGENNSRYHLREIKAMIRESDIQVDAIGLFDTALFKTYEEYMGKKWLGEITDATGGRTLPIDNLSMLPQAAATISWELRNQYVLGYKPADRTARPGRRRIKVLLTSRLKVPFLRPYYRREYSVP